VIAMCVLERATAMSAFDDPKTAFSKTEERVEAGSGGYSIYCLEAALKGHEMLVASSNNKAVENVSKELPAIGAVAHAWERLNYFKSISDLIHGPRKKFEDEDDKDEDIAPEPVETWGLIAAVLGNMSNRRAFWEAFWWNKDRGIKTYLQTVMGRSVLIARKDKTTGVITKRIPKVVLREKPPSSQQAKESWKTARSRFLALKAEVDAELANLEEVRRLCSSLVEPRRQLAKRERELAARHAGRDEWTKQLAVTVEEHEQAAARHARALSAWKQHKSVRPGLLARLLRTDDAKAWAEEDAVWRRPAETAARERAAAQDAMKKAERARSLAAAKVQVLEIEVETERARLAKPSQAVAEHRALLAGRLVDEEKFQEGHARWNQATPWITEALNSKREELFIAALALHRAFIDAAAEEVFHNLGALQVLSKSAQNSEEKRAFLGDLWSTLFLVVPVLSTTFASVERMLSEMPPATLGWLLIDEAGQATPQAAIGAILRAKRVVAVGDPLQILPVVSLPLSVTAAICNFFQVDELDWAAPVASTQTLTDRISRYQSSFEGMAGERRVGFPLLVHRRCQNPMFTISNKIAYAGQMVQVVDPRKLAVDAMLRTSKWIDIGGDAASKWSAAEGEAVIELLTRLASAAPKPDVFVITPFREVMQEMTLALKEHPDLLRKLGNDRAKWLKDRVGTIHTFQGREADTVILLLGASADAHKGAREWAAGTPNILNVAVSRAKQNLYVVGSRTAWGSVGLAASMLDELKNHRSLDT